MDLRDRTVKVCVCTVHSFQTASCEEISTIDPYTSIDEYDSHNNNEYKFTLAQKQLTENPHLYLGNGSICLLELDSCFSNPCQNNGTCSGNLSNYSCECANGFKGQNCEGLR